MDGCEPFVLENMTLTVILQNGHKRISCGKCDRTGILVFFFPGGKTELKKKKRTKVHVEIMFAQHDHSGETR